MAVAPKGASLMQKLAFQWKRGWHEVPELMVTFLLFGTGASGTLYLTYMDYTKENRTRQFKTVHTIMRPDDDMAKWLKRNERSPPITRTPMPNTKFC